MSPMTQGLRGLHPVNRNCPVTHSRPISPSPAPHPPSHFVSEFDSFKQAPRVSGITQCLSFCVWLVSPSSVSSGSSHLAPRDRISFLFEAGYYSHCVDGPHFVHVHSWRSPGWLHPLAVVPARFPGSDASAGNPFKPVTEGTREPSQEHRPSRTVWWGDVEGHEEGNEITEVTACSPQTRKQTRVVLNTVGRFCVLSCYRITTTFPSLDDLRQRASCPHALWTDS